MKIISDRKDLPKWFFEKDRYSWLKDASIQLLEQEWDRRYAAYVAYKSGTLKEAENSGGMVASIYAEAVTPCLKNEEVNLPLRTGLIDCLETGDLLLRTIGLTHSGKTLDELLLAPLDPVTDGVLLEILLDEITDAEILQALEVLLPRIRKKLKKPEPSINKEKKPTTYNMGPRINKLRTKGVFEFTDLYLWSKYNDKSISNPLYAAIIKPGLYSDKKISKLKTEITDTLLQPRFLELLCMHAKGIL